jgi:hypothetical protein
VRRKEQKTHLRRADDEGLVGAEGGAKEILGRVLVALEPPDGSRLQPPKEIEELGRACACACVRVRVRVRVRCVRWWWKSGGTVRTSHRRLELSLDEVSSSDPLWLIATDVTSLPSPQ